MKSFLILLLLLNISCNKEDPVAGDEKSEQPMDSSTGGTSGGTTGGGTSGGTSGGTTGGDQVTVTKTVEFMKLINDHRVSIGMKALIHTEELGDIATTHSENMAMGITPFGHDGFSERCSEARSVLGGGNLCGENVAMGQKTVAAAFTAWMNSPGHRSNIEQPRVTHTGFGYMQNSNGAYYWTQIFVEKN